VQDWCAAHNPLVAASETGALASPGEQAQGEPALSEQVLGEPAWGKPTLGINLVRQHARDLAWSRIGNCNRLALTVPR